MDPSDPGPRGQDEHTALRRGLRGFSNPWFWLLLVGGLWAVPLFKSLGAELPPPLPGVEGAPVEFELLTLGGRSVALAELEGHLLVLRELHLEDADRARGELRAMHELRARLRGLGSAVLFVLLAIDGSMDQLESVLDDAMVRKPTQVFLHDPSAGVWSGVLESTDLDSGGAAVQSILIDRHGRVRGVYGADERSQDRLVREAGQLANWPASDPPPGGARSVAGLD